MNINYGLMEAVKTRTKDKRGKNLEIAHRALEEVKRIINILDNS
jgi:folate-dependent tRNA-U54 methylase TrmFO/GidA